MVKTVCVNRVFLIYYLLELTSYQAKSKINYFGGGEEELISDICINFLKVVVISLLCTVINNMRINSKVNNCMLY